MKSYQRHKGKALPTERDEIPRYCKSKTRRKDKKFGIEYYELYRGCWQVYRWYKTKNGRDRAMEHLLKWEKFFNPPRFWWGYTTQYRKINRKG